MAYQSLGSQTEVTGDKGKREEGGLVRSKGIQSFTARDLPCFREVGVFLHMAVPCRETYLSLFLSLPREVNSGELRLWELLSSPEPEEEAPGRAVDGEEKMARRNSRKGPQDSSS